MARYDLSDEELRFLVPLLPKHGKGGYRVDDRRVVNGIFYVLRTGASWRDLPEHCGQNPINPLACIVSPG